MSLEMMPKMLKNMLITLLADNSISSWNIRGVENFNQVTIRFHNDNMAATDNISYRKAPPSRQARDNRRQSEWKPKNQECDSAVSNMDDDNALLKFDTGILLPSQKTIEYGAFKHSNFSIRVLCICYTDKYIVLVMFCRTLEFLFVLLM